jgi:hypothetical protein
MMLALSQVLGLLTADQWIKLIVVLPSLIETARKIGEDVHPALLALESILQEGRAAGANAEEAAQRAAEAMPGWMAQFARNNDAAIALQPAGDGR